MLYYIHIKFIAHLVANNELIETGKKLLTEKRLRQIRLHNEKLNGKVSRKWDDEDLIERRDDDNKFVNNDIRKNIPVGKHEPRIVELFAANPTREFTAGEVAMNLGFIYKSNIYDPLNNLLGKGLIDSYVYPTGRKVWRYKN